MLSRDSSDLTSSTSNLEQIFANASKELYPRLALFETLAQFGNGQKRRMPSGDDVIEARRDFLDSFTYLCDIQKGGATVTAAGLQKLAYSNVLWLAANEGILINTEIYANAILSKLQSVDSSSRGTVENQIFQLAIENCKPRIAAYKEELQKYARNCRMQLRKEPRNEAGETCHHFK
jgi:hypothetical protein